MIGEIQKSLFETGPLSDSKLVAKTKLENSGRNLAVAFGVTKTGLNKGNPYVLKYIFYGGNNLEIGLEIPSRENAAEILSKRFAAGILKKWDAHFNLTRDFLELVRFLDDYSYSKIGFASLAQEFKKYFGSSPGKQMERLKLLEQSVEDVGKEFVDSFFTKYKFSNKEKEFDYDFYDRGDKEFYVDEIYKELKSSSDKAKGLWG